MVTIDDIVGMDIKYLTPVEVGIPSRNWKKEGTKTFLGYFAGFGEDGGADTLRLYEYLDAPDIDRKIIESKKVGYGPDGSIHIEKQVLVKNIKYIRILERSEKERHF